MPLQIFVTSFIEFARYFYLCSLITQNKFIRATDDSSKEVNAAVVMLVLVIMHCCVYLPNAVFWITWDFGAILGVTIKCNAFQFS